MMIVSIEKSKLENAQFWFKLNNLDENDTEAQKEIFQTFYWLNEGMFKLIKP